MVELSAAGEIVREVDLSAYFQGEDVFVSSLTASGDGVVLTAAQNRTGADGRYFIESAALKLTSGLEKAWSRTIQGDVLSSAAAPDGAVVLATRNSGGPVGVVKLASADGAVLWQREHTPPAERYIGINGYALTPSLYGGWIVAGEVHELNRQTAYVLKLDADGRKEWDRTFYAAQSWIQGIASDGGNRYLAAGQTHPIGTEKPKSFALLLRTTELRPIEVRIDGTALPLATAPRIVDGTTLLPLRELFGALGANVDFDAATQTIRAVRGEREVTLRLGSSSASLAVGGEAQAMTMAVPAQAMSGTTMVPLRFVGEALGCTLEWNEAARRIDIATK